MYTNWVRSGGLAALVAGILRAVNAFIPNTTAGVNMLYLVTDLTILWALIGLALWLPKQTGQRLNPLWLAFIGTGILIIRDLMPAWSPLYPLGALLLTGGLCWLAIDLWNSGKLPRWIPTFWLLSTLIGIVGFFTPGLNLLFVSGGVLFGLSFIGVGIAIMR